MRAAHPLRAMAGRGVHLRAKFGLSSSPYFGSRSLHVTNPEALPPPAPAAHALLCIADHRVGGRWSRHSRGTPGQKPYCNPDSNSLSHHGHPPLRLKPTVLHLGAHPRVAQSVRSPSHHRLRRGTSLTDVMRTVARCWYPRTTRARQRAERGGRDHDIRRM